MSIYFDHAATTTMLPAARDAWLAATETLGNASSVHGAGQAARRLLEESRERIAVRLDADPIEVVFTSGATEAINLAVKGLWWARAAGRGAVVLPDGEHHASMDAVAWLEAVDGAAVRAVPLDPLGRIRTDAFAAALTGAHGPGSGAAALASALMANNEIGTLQPAAALSAAAAEAGVPLHLDAVGAVGAVPVSFRGLRGDAVGAAGLAALSISGHKLGAPMGIGALVVSRAATLVPLMHGGGQQRSLRSGTQDVAGASALATALEIVDDARETDAARVAALRDRLWRALRAAVPELELLGDPDERLPGNLHLHLPGAAGETMLFLLDRHGISVSTGSACQAGVTEPSHVVTAIGRDARTAAEVLRITLGRSSTDAEVDALVAALPDAYRRAARAR